MDLVFYISKIKKIDTYGSCVSNTHYKWIHDVNMQFKKIPTTSYAMQQRDGGMISQGIGRKIIQTFEPIVLSQMSMREPINSQLPILTYAPYHLILPRVGLAINALGMERYGSQFCIRAIHRFWEIVFCLSGKKTPRN